MGGVGDGVAALMQERSSGINGGNGGGGRDMRGTKTSVEERWRR
jgi:hypothetical protein